MPKVELHFYGRFAYTKAGRDIVAMAPHFKSPFEVHRPLMSIRRDAIVFVEHDGTPVTTLEPMLRMASDVTVAHPAGGNEIPTPEVLVWDVSGLTVVVGAPADSSFTPGAELLNLRELNVLGQTTTTTLKASALTATAEPGSGESNTVIRLFNTSVRPEALDPIAVTQLATREDVAAKCPPDSPIRTPQGEPVQKRPADFVRCVVPIGSTSVVLTFTAGDGQVKKVSVKAGATVTFSDLCTRIKAPQNCDIEFAQYYSLAVSTPASKEVVPFVPDGGATGEGMGCYNQAQLP